jgi:phage terminase large subunit-like protein
MQLRTAPRQHVPFELFAAECFVEDPVTGLLAPFRLYPLQRTFADAMFDQRNERGLRRYRRGLFSVPKKLGKSGLAAVSGLYMLMHDEFEMSREVYSLAWDLDQARLVFKAAKRIIERSPLFQKFRAAGFLSVFKDEIVYQEGDVSGIFRPLAHDSKGLHGISPTCRIVDEGWTFVNYDLLEATALPPTRRSPLDLWVSYAGLKAQQEEGNPLWDLFQAGMHETDPELFFLYRSGRAANFEAPWMTEEYLRRQELALPANRFQRLHLNEWGSSDTAFLTAAEIERAMPSHLGRVPGDTRYPWVCAVDYGRTHDHTAIIVARRTPTDDVVIGELITMKGSRENPVPLELVEDTLVDLKHRFRLTHIRADQWQFAGSSERLRKRGVPVELVSIGPAYLNSITTNFLSLMRNGRLQCFHHPEFAQQLGAVIVKETFYGIRIDSGVGAGVRARDDMVIASAMAAHLAIEKGVDRQFVTFSGRSGRDPKWRSLSDELDHCRRMDVQRERERAVEDTRQRDVLRQRQRNAAGVR